MSSETSYSGLYSLLSETDPDCRTNGLISSMVDTILRSDTERDTRFELSIKTKDGGIEDSFRLVNYEGRKRGSRPLATSSARMALIENLLEMVCPGIDLVKTIGFLKRTVYPFPIYIGMESLDGDSRLKLYINFYELNRKNPDVAAGFLRTFLSHNGITPPPLYGNIILLGLSFDNHGLQDEYKIYRSHDKSALLPAGGFSSKERDLFSWLNEKNKLGYFDVMERYRNGRCFSRKIEVHPYDDGTVLENFLERAGRSDLLVAVSRVVRRAGRELEVIAMEDCQFTFYITLSDDEL